MPENEQKDWLTVRETAERLGRSEETVRRMIRACKLPASRSGEGPRAAWLINASALERQLEVQATEQRVRDRGIVTGYGDFIEQVEARYGAPLADTLREVRERHELLERLATELHADPDVAERFEQLDDEERIERAAQELARRVRREERIRERAREILEEDDTD